MYSCHWEGQRRHFSPFPCFQEWYYLEKRMTQGKRPSPLGVQHFQQTQCQIPSTALDMSWPCAHRSSHRQIQLMMTFAVKLSPFAEIHKTKHYRKFHEICHSVTFYFMKKDSKRSCDTTTPSQFTPKMKANAVPRLLSSLV